MFKLLCFSCCANTCARSKQKNSAIWRDSPFRKWRGYRKLFDNFRGGKILTIEDASNIRIDISDAEYHDVIGKHVYPGFILPNTTLGLADIDAVRATKDFDEVGEFNPHIRSIIAYNTDSPVIPTVRTNGVLIGQITPRGGMVSGTSSLVEFDAWNYEDALYKEDDAIHVNWPEKRFSFVEHDHKKNHDDEYEKDLSEIKEFL